MSARRLALSLCALAVPCTATRAWAESASADAAIAHGVALRREHQDEAALGEFRRAYSIEPTPRALAQVALAEAALEQWVAAEADLLRALAADDVWIETRRKALQLALEEIDTHLGALEVSGPVGAQVWIDGVFAADLPRGSLRVPARHLLVALRAEGSTLARAEVDVSAGASARVAFALQPGRVEPPLAEQTPPHISDASGYRTVAWVATGSAALFVAVGAGLTALAADRASRFNDDAQCGDLPGMPRSVRCAGYAAAARAAQAGEIAAYALAGVAGSGSALLFLTLPHDTGRRPRAAVRPTLGGVMFLYAF